MTISLAAEAIRQDPVKGKPLRRDLRQGQTHALAQAIPVGDELDHWHIRLFGGNALLSEQADDIPHRLTSHRRNDFRRPFPGK